MPVYLKSIYRMIMKKYVFTLILAGSLAVSACSTYTCPTYARVPAAKPIRHANI